jgi:hypothetical protein
LREAHRHEKPLPLAEDQIAYPDFRITEEFMAEREEELLFVAYALVQGALKTHGALDSDVLAALDALIRTHKTRESGLVYETRAENTIAASVQRSVSESLNEYRKLRQERNPLSPVRDSDLAAIFIFLLRVGQSTQNGRPKGRMFIDWLSRMIPETKIEEAAPSIIV